jgi:hypothetical protein
MGGCWKLEMGKAGDGMDGSRFDAWTRSLHSRRAVVPMLVSLGVGLGLTRPSGAVPTPAKKHKRPTFGCTKQDNACTGSGLPTPCPDAPAGSGANCVNDNKGKPFCAVIGVCAPCKKNRDCADAGPGAICVKKCPVCQPSGFKTACLVPLTDH